MKKCYSDDYCKLHVHVTVKGSYSIDTFTD